MTREEYLELSREVLKDIERIKDHFEKLELDVEESYQGLEDEDEDEFDFFNDAYEAISCIVRVKTALMKSIRDISWFIVMNS